MSTNTGSQRGLQNKIQRLVIMSMLVAIVFVLQYLGGSIPLLKDLGVGIAITLVPIVLGAVLYGQIFGAILGAVFGLVVAYSVIQGQQGPVVAQMYALNPALTLSLCIVKGAAAGFVAGLVAKIFAKKNLSTGVFIASAACPVVNTALFLGALMLYKNMAGAEDLFFVIVLCNFGLELLLNIVCAPAIVRTIQALKKSGVLKVDTGNV